MDEEIRWEDANFWVEIDLDLCNGVGKCVNVCSAGVYELVAGKVNANKIANCVGCCSCRGVCPTYALSRHWAWE